MIEIGVGIALFVIVYSMLLKVLHAAENGVSDVKRLGKRAARVAVQKADQALVPCAAGLAPHKPAKTTDDCGNVVEYCSRCRGPL